MTTTPLKAPPKIGGPGSVQALGTSWTICTLPTLPDGSRARYMMLSWDANTFVHVRAYPGTGMTRGIALNPARQPYVIDVHGVTAIYGFRYEAGTTADLHMTPLGNQ
jgi:hypothetical protein